MRIIEDTQTTKVCMTRKYAYTTQQESNIHRIKLMHAGWRVTETGRTDGQRPYTRTFYKEVVI